MSKLRRPTVRVGIVGAGFVAHLHAEAYRQVRGIEVDLRWVTGAGPARAGAFAEEFGVTGVAPDLTTILADPEVDVVDLCVPNHLHAPLGVQAAQAGKHVVVEKPLTGFFGPHTTPPSEMLRAALASADELLRACRAAAVRLCYAENWVYSPPVAKLRRLIRAAGGGILDVRAEENHSGSHSTFARRWKHSGGGALLRMGVHSVGACLHLKAYEGEVRDGRPIRPVSVVADVAPLMRTETARRGPTKWIAADPEDVENWANVVIAFEDGTRGKVTVSDAGLGGLQAKIAVYLTNAVLHANMAQNTAVQAYAPGPDIFGDEYFTEKIETKAGWTFPSPDEDWFRGYPQEIRDFVDAIREDREPLAGIDLAVECTEVIYAAYLSAAEGRRVSLAGR